jgi:hypothetical protein
MSTSPIVFWSSTPIPTLRCRRSRVNAGSSPSAVIRRRLCRPPLRRPLGRRMIAIVRGRSERRAWVGGATGRPIVGDPRSDQPAARDSVRARSPWAHFVSGTGQRTRSGDRCPSFISKQPANFEGKTPGKNEKHFSGFALGVRVGDDLINPLLPKSKHRRMTTACPLWRARRRSRVLASRWTRKCEILTGEVRQLNSRGRCGILTWSRTTSAVELTTRTCEPA